MKKLLVSILLSITSLPAFAHDTKSNDKVGVHYSIVKDDGTVPVEKTYFKVFGQLKLDKSSLMKIDSHIAAINKQNDLKPKFKIVFVSIVNNDLSRVLLVSNRGDAYAIDFNDGKNCGITIDGNGLMLTSKDCVEF